MCFESSIPVGPYSSQYKSCTAGLCPGIDESDFAVQIFKDVATIRDLTPQGTPVNLDKFHYTVTEDTINPSLDEAQCFASGFSSSTIYLKQTRDAIFEYHICIKYVGDCDGTIYPVQVKTCTVENYIFSGSIKPIKNLQTNNAVDSAITTGTTTTTSQSNNTIPTTRTTTTTQSSNVIGAPQSNSVGLPNTFSSSTASSSLLGDILSSNPN
jgi:hypothetical protein